MFSSSHLVRGALVGSAATGAMSLLEILEWRWLGRRPRYVPSQIARAAAARLGARLDDRAAHRLGLAMRWTYGATLGVLFTGTHARRRLGALPAGLAAGLAIAALELPAMHALGATPHPRDWPPDELAALLYHTTVWGLAAALTDRALDP